MAQPHFVDQSSAKRRNGGFLYLVSLLVVSMMIRESTCNTNKNVQIKSMAINTIVLGDMEVPESYLDSLPKNGRASLGDVMHRYITSDQFSPECLLDCFALSSEHQVLEIANRVEASMYVWCQRANPNMNRSSSKSSWGMVKEMMVDVDKRGLLADRAESLLLCLKQRFPGLPQTALDMSKIQFNNVYVLSFICCLITTSCTRTWNCLYLG